jgi:hypothetical protein
MITNYTSLVAALGAWEEGEDIAGVESELVQMAEADLNLRVGTRHRFLAQSIATVAAQQTYTLNAQARRVLYVRGTTATQPKLDFMAPEQFYAEAMAYESGQPVRTR